MSARVLRRIAESRARRRGRSRQSRGDGRKTGTPESRVRQRQGKPDKLGGTAGAEENRAGPGQIRQRRGHSGGIAKQIRGNRGIVPTCRGNYFPRRGQGRSPWRSDLPPPSSRHKCFFLRDDEGMPSSSRYLATVRRAILTPRPSLRRELMSSSDRGWDWSSPSMRARMRALTLSEPT